MDKTLQQQIEELILFNFKQPLIIVSNDTHNLSKELNQSLTKHNTYFSNYITHATVENLHFFSPDVQGKKIVILEDLEINNSEKQLFILNRIQKHKDIQIIITTCSIEKINPLITNNSVQIYYNNEPEVQNATVVSLFKKK